MSHVYISLWQFCQYMYIKYILYIMLHSGKHLYYHGIHMYMHMYPYV